MRRQNRPLRRVHPVRFLDPAADLLYSADRNGTFIDDHGEILQMVTNAASN